MNSATRAAAVAAFLLPLAAHAQLSALAAARQGFETKVALPKSTPQPAPTPPKDAFLKVVYASRAGILGAYLTPNPRDGAKHPAIVWITGGDCNTIDDVWTPKSRANDQSAAAYRKAGIVMMFPSLRGGNDNPGRREAFYGEVDDVLAAADYLARLPYVDPQRIYLGGHSTGGTLALLTAEASPRFRAVFAFGPVSKVQDYGPDLIPTDFSRLDAREANLRSPDMWLESAAGRVFVIEGSGGNFRPFTAMRSKSRNPQVTFLAVDGASHFSVLAPANEVIARAILADTGPATRIELSEAQLAAALRGR
jgi:acetyl esterase/lipase